VGRRRYGGTECRYWEACGKMRGDYDGRVFCGEDKWINLII
jgi:hypothetical protein